MTWQNMKYLDNTESCGSYPKNETWDGNDVSKETANFEDGISMKRDFISLNTGLVTMYSNVGTPLMRG